MCRKKNPDKKGFFGEFKEFITRGNVIDMAVGIIIGGAFTAIITALVQGVFQPLINWIISAIAGKNGLEAARTILGQPVYKLTETGEHVYEVVNGVTVWKIDWENTNYINWGSVISAVINFLLVALILFLIIKAINHVHEKGVAAKEKLTGKDSKEKEEEK